MASLSNETVRRPEKPRTKSSARRRGNLESPQRKGLPRSDDQSCGVLCSAIGSMSANPQHFQKENSQPGAQHWPAERRIPQVIRGKIPSQGRKRPWEGTCQIFPQTAGLRMVGSRCNAAVAENGGWPPMVRRDGLVFCWRERSRPTGEGYFAL